MSDEIEWKLGEMDDKFKTELKDLQEKVRFLEKDNNSLRRKLEDHDDELRSNRRKMAPPPRLRYHLTVCQRSLCVALVVSSVFLLSQVQEDEMKPWGDKVFWVASGCAGGSELLVV